MLLATLFDGACVFPLTLTSRVPRIVRAVCSHACAGVWRLRAGIDKPEHLPYMWHQRLHGCAYPDRYYVIRPNGAVAPCIYWERDPIGLFPAQDFGQIAAGKPLGQIREGLRRGEPIGSCANCTERRAALYRLRPLSTAPDAPRQLPTHPR